MRMLLWVGLAAAIMLVVILAVQIYWLWIDLQTECPGGNQCEDAQTSLQALRVVAGIVGALAGMSAFMLGRLRKRARA